MRTGAGPALVAATMSLLLAAACSTESGPVSAPAPPVTEGEHDPGPMTDLNVVCAGEGAPTVILVPGLDTSGDVFTDLADRLAGTARTCWYDRAGIGDSPPQDAEWPDPSPASQAGDLRSALARQGIAGPYVVLGWSYGGLVAQAFALSARDLTAGLVLEDTSVREQFTDPLMMSVDEEVGVHWAEGGREIDVEELKRQLDRPSFRGVPLVVLSQDASGPWGRAWLGYHDDLARASRDGIHLVGLGSGHVMHEDVPDLVVAAVQAVVLAARGTQPLGPCDARLTAAGGRCRQL